MDTATRDRNIATWLGDAPQPVRDTTNQLLERIALLRAEQTIYPAQDDILNALAYTPADQVKVVILGQDPYHGPNQAMGLSFSVPATQTKLPPSLRNIYKELNADLGCPIPATGDLTPWAQQGVLLLNTTLTVREHAANSHAKLGWSTLTDYIIERCCQLPQPVVFLAWGRFAQQMVEASSPRLARARQPASSALPPRTPRRFRQPCHGRTPRFYGVASLLGSQSATRTARLDPRQLDLPRLKIDTSKTRPTAFHRARFLFGPNKLCAAGLAAIDQQALPGHKPVGHAHKVDPLGDLLGGGPALKRRELHNLVPQVFVFHHATVERRDNAARVHTVGNGLRCQAVCKVLGVGDNAALAGSIGRKLRSRMPARRPHIDHGLIAAPAWRQAPPPQRRSARSR